MTQDCAVCCDVHRSLYDHTERFERYFRGRAFSSYEELLEVLRQFEEECCVKFRIRSSVLSGPGDPCVYSKVKMVCTYAAREHETVSLCIRKGRTRARDCPAKFTVNQINGVLVVGKRCPMLVHNHRCSEMEYRLDPSVRRLTPEEKKDVMRFIKYGTPSNRIRLMARLEYGKYLTRCDITRLRREMMESAVPADTWRQFEAVVQEGGKFSCTRDGEGKIDCISFCRKEQVEIFKRYPEVVCMDATYNINRSRFCLLQMVVTDGLGHGRCVMYSLMRDEKCGTYATALLDFRDFMANTSRLQTFVVDMSYAQMRAIKTVFPTKKILVCTFHMLRAVHRKCKNRLIRHLVKRLVNTTSVVRFTALCQRLRQKFPRFYIYFSRVWLKQSHRWAACYGAGTVCLGNRTNNRAESAHRWLKRDLYAGDTLLNCCKRIWLSSHQMLVDYVCDAALSRMRRPIVPMNNPLRNVVHSMTRFAAEMTLKEWESANNPMSVIQNGGDVKVVEEFFSRRLSYKVDLAKPICSCMFNVMYAMPCRHLVFACMKMKAPIDSLLRNSRWLDAKLDGVEQPEVTFTHQPVPEKRTSKVVALMRRANQFRRTLPPDEFDHMLEKVSTVMDAFEVAVITYPPIHSIPSSPVIPPLRQRILNPQNATTSGSITTITVPTHTEIAPELTHTRKVKIISQSPVDIDQDEKENHPTSGQSDPQKPL